MNTESTNLFHKTFALFLFNEIIFEILRLVRK